MIFGSLPLAKENTEGNKTNKSVYDRLDVS